MLIDFHQDNLSEINTFLMRKVEEIDDDNQNL